MTPKPKDKPAAGMNNQVLFVELGEQDEAEECRKPCPPGDPCEDCEGYWHRMRAEGFWIDGKGWTEKAYREWMK